MEPLSRPRAIIEYCLAPLGLDLETEPGLEVHRRLEHAIKAFQRAAPTPVAVDFSTMRTNVIDEAAHGNE